MNNNFSHYLPLMSCLHYEGMLNGLYEGVI